MKILLDEIAYTVNIKTASQLTTINVLLTHTTFIKTQNTCL